MVVSRTRYRVVAHSAARPTTDNSTDRQPGSSAGAKGRNGFKPVGRTGWGKSARARPTRKCQPIEPNASKQPAGDDSRATHGRRPSTARPICRTRSSRSWEKLEVAEAGWAVTKNVRPANSIRRSGSEELIASRAICRTISRIRRRTWLRTTAMPTDFALTDIPSWTGPCSSSGVGARVRTHTRSPRMIGRAAIACWSCTLPRSDTTARDTV
jgi:hypothetical protein